ncbi:hypothetical protein E2C01_045710 [Portunus trituberculatus]|uniref:Uncharacterized protein n=1 Tax=Portunus trituberculatus TaxID=210409 RepID=A0A5B7G240_PORTR|nr:hypothetical protein [Portunus trituberculatus]
MASTSATGGTGGSKDTGGGGKDESGRGKRWSNLEEPGDQITSMQSTSLKVIVAHLKLSDFDSGKQCQQRI